jgi:hypothetical protein
VPCRPSHAHAWAQREMSLNRWDEVGASPPGYGSVRASIAVGGGIPPMCMYTCLLCERVSKSLIGVTVWMLVPHSLSLFALPLADTMDPARKSA